MLVEGRVRIEHSARAGVRGAGSVLPVPRRHAPNPRCQLCNLFMSWADVRNSVAWTPYAHGFQYEIPDEEFAHWKCWKQATESERTFIRRIAWIPVAHRGKLA